MSEELHERVAARPWYHTIELAPGIETPGWFDCRGIAPTVLPDDLSGRRCLDIGTYDGFWAFQLEQRGASEVIAFDVLDDSRWDWPAGETAGQRAINSELRAGAGGFPLAKEALGSSVERVDASIYDLDPGVHGRFDVVYVGSLLLHLRDPVGALMKIRAVCDELLISADAVHGSLSLIGSGPAATLEGRGRPYWWTPNTAGYARMAEAAGFAITNGPNRFRMPPGRGHPRPPLRPGLLLNAQKRAVLVDSRLGNGHAWLHARPG